MMIPRWIVSVAFIIVLCVSAHAHEVRPAQMDITEHGGGRVVVRWRQPITGEYALALAPLLSSGWLDGDPGEFHLTANSLVKLWVIDRPAETLAGQTLWIRGLDRTITDVLVKIEFADGRKLRRLIRPAHPGMQIPLDGSSRFTLPEFLQLGISHIWSGPDHLLYIFALILLIHGLRSLVATITAFTLAHSITLALSILGQVQLRTAPVEAVIALSIVYVAVELHRQRGENGSGLAWRYPWLIAFVFGLLHGFGFASALRETGIPEHSVGPALFLFNVGVEIGQVLFLIPVLFILRVLKKLLEAHRDELVRTASYGIGALASFWCIVRLAAIF